MKWKGLNISWTKGTPQVRVQKEQEMLEGVVGADVGLAGCENPT